MKSRTVSPKTQLFIDMLPGSTLIFSGSKYDVPKRTLARRGMKIMVSRHKQNNTTIVTKV
jgi:hypothetical protein